MKDMEQEYKATGNALLMMKLDLQDVLYDLGNLTEDLKEHNYCDEELYLAETSYNNLLRLMELL